MARIAPTSAGWKPFFRQVTDDESVMAYVKWNPYRLLAIDGSTQVDRARMQVQASQINFDINAVADTTIGTYAGNTGGDDAVMFADAATIRGLINLTNGLQLGIDRYIAAYADYRPGYVIGTGDGLAVALSNIMRGVHDRGLEVFADVSGHAVANTFGVGVGTRGGCRAGSGQRIPDLLQAEYTSTVAGVVTRVRNAALSAEKHPFVSQFETKITRIHFGAAYASNAKTISVYDKDDVLVHSRVLGSATDYPDAANFDFDNPIVQAVGPLFVEATGSSTLTDGPLAVSGFVRVG